MRVSYKKKMSYQNLLVRVGALSGGLAVVLGAFGAHGLQNRPGMDAKMLANWNTAGFVFLIFHVVIFL